METNILPINEHPSIYSGIHLAYPCAIIESLQLSKIILNGDTNQYHVKEVNCRVGIDKNEVRVYQTNGEKSDVVLFRKCFCDDMIQAQIAYFKPFTNDRFVDLFLCKYNEDIIYKEINSEDKSVGFRWNQFGFFERKRMFSYDTKKYRYIKLEKKNKKVIGYASGDGKDWLLLNEIILTEEENNSFYIGVHIHFGKDVYQAWKNMNFYQLGLNVENEWKGVYLDYFSFPRKGVDNSYMFFQNHIDTTYETIYEVLDAFESIHDYIKWSINHFYYVNLCMDEYYVPKRKAYNQYTYSHYNLFYGYDDNKGEYYVMGYSEFGKPILSSIPYRSVNQMTIKSEKLIRYRYFSNDVKELSFDIHVVRQAIYEFLNGINSGKKYGHILATEDLFFGLSALQTLLDDDRGRFLLVNDKRISFCLFEHSKLMLEHIEYIFINGYIEKESCEALQNIAKSCINNAGTVMTMVLKNLLNDSEQDGIFRSMADLINKEKELFEFLFNAIANTE